LTVRNPSALLNDRIKMKLASIEDVYAAQLGDLRSAEIQLIEALPALAEAASDRKLKQAFTQHLEQTERHVERLDEIIASSPSPVVDDLCEAMRGLISESHRIIRADGPGEVKDVALIAAAQRVEHYEISAYGTARALADQLDQRDARQLLSETLEEESQADELLTKLAIGGLLVAGLNERAQP
jgi:ferritin-like metal-binding protein YciE